MRILMLAQFYSPVIGGEERHVQDLSIELVRRGHEVTVATLYLPGTAEFEIDQGVRIHRIKSSTQRAAWLYSQKERSHAPPVPDPEVLRTLRRIIGREKPDIVHAHNWLLYSFLPLKKRSRAPLVVTLHDYSLCCSQKRLMNAGVFCSGPELVKCMACAGGHYGKLRGGIISVTHRLASQAVYDAVDMFLPVSDATALYNRLDEHNLPYRVIPNFLPDDIERVNEGVDGYLERLPRGEFLLFVGDLSRDKGVDVLVRAYTGLTNAPPLVLIGRLRPDTPTDLPANVLALGSWPHPAVMEAWRRSSIGLAPSTCAETFGIVVIEAMAMGSPVIASRIGGLGDIVMDGENGLLAPPGDVDALRAAIQRLIDQPDVRLAMGEAARRRSAAFRASQVIPQIEDVYRKLVHGAASVSGDFLERQSEASL
ncbi:MAG: glycosyltransferase family 4 protein [Chloroflexota bacterium]